MYAITISKNLVGSVRHAFRVMTLSDFLAVKSTSFHLTQMKPMEYLYTTLLTHKSQGKNYDQQRSAESVSYCLA